MSRFFDRIYRRWFASEIVRGETPRYRHIEPGDLFSVAEQEARQAIEERRGTALGDRMAAEVRAEVARQGGNKRKAARVLGISPTTLYRYLGETEGEGGTE